MLKISTPSGLIIQAGETPHEISAARYLRFNQACIRELGLGADLTDLNSHLRKLGQFIQASSPATGTAYTNFLQGINSIESAVPLTAIVLATVTLSVGPVPCLRLTDKGLAATAQRILDTGITQAALVEAVEAVKKNCNPNS